MNDISQPIEQSENQQEVLRKQIIVFDLDGEEYAVPIEDVQEVIKLTDITPLPSSPSFILGIINLRGNIVPVLDLEKRFSLQRKSQTPYGHILVTQTENNFGILVDKVTEVISIDPNKIKPSPQVISQKISNNYIQGVIVINNDEEEKVNEPTQEVTQENNQRVLLILRIKDIVSEKELQKIAEMEEKLPKVQPVINQPTSEITKQQNETKEPLNSEVEKLSGKIKGQSPVEIEEEMTSSTELIDQKKETNEVKETKLILKPLEILTRVKNKVLNPENN